jgi:hypothetical protein
MKVWKHGNLVPACSNVLKSQIEGQKKEKQRSGVEREKKNLVL